MKPEPRVLFRVRHTVKQFYIRVSHAS